MHPYEKITNEIVISSLTVSLDFRHSFKPKEFIEFEEKIELKLWNEVKFKIPERYKRYIIEPNGFEKNSIIDMYSLSGMEKTFEGCNLKYTLFTFKRIFPEGNLEFVLCTSLRRYFLRRDLLLEKRKDNHVKSRLKNADI